MWGKEIDGIPIIGNAEAIAQVEYDEILICSLPGLYIIRKQLIEAGVDGSKINSDYIKVQVDARINFIRDFVKVYNPDSDEVSVAEGGVFQGEFAKEINTCFPNAKLYLFDTFEGFDKRDIVIEDKNDFSEEKEGHLHTTSEWLVLDKMPHKEKVIIRKGYFPETAKGLEDEQFVFVNLDFDLYNPILEGLRFFYPRMKTNGVILVHDYFNPGYQGVEKAVCDYEKEFGENLVKLPIGDHCSIAIVKK